MARTKAEDPLSTYRAKRDFSKTAEPAQKARRNLAAALSFRSMRRARPHFDFRLELDGVLKSWAVTKGPRLGQARGGWQ